MKSNRNLFFFLAFFVEGILLFVVSRIINFDGAYGQDAYEYLRFSESIKEFLTEGNPLGPFNWPIGYPSFVGLIDIIIQNIFISGQIVSIVFWLLSCYVGFRFLNLLYGNQIKRSYLLAYSLIFIGFSPYFLRLGVSSMSDVACGFFVLSTFYFWEVFKKNHSYRFIVFAVVMGTSAIMVRNAAAVIILIPFLLIAYHLLVNKKWGVIFVCLASFSILISPTFLIEKPSLLGYSVNYSDMFNYKSFFVPAKVNGDQGLHEYSLPNIIYMFYGFFHPAFFFAGIPFVFIMFWGRMRNTSRNWNKEILFSVLIYALFIGGIYFQNKRFFVIQTPLVVMLFSVAFVKLNKLIKKRYLFNSIIVVSLFVNVVLSFYTLKKIYQIQQFEKKVVSELKPYQNHTLYLFEIDSALKQRGLNFNYVNLWYKEVDSFDKNGYVLFNEERFSYQWENNNVMKNWDKLKEEYQLIKLIDFNGGYSFYKIN